MRNNVSDSNLQILLKEHSTSCLLVDWIRFGRDWQDIVRHGGIADSEIS
jgi:hypothetical protein